MSQVLIICIRAYQFLVSPVLQTAFGPTSGCVYELTCSEFAIVSIRSHGAFRGIVLGVKRILSCHP